MRLKVIHRAGCYYDGHNYRHGEFIEIDERAHNAAAQIRYLKHLKKVEAVIVTEPVGHVASTVPAPGQARAPAAPVAEPPVAQPDAPARGRYRRRDLRAD